MIKLRITLGDDTYSSGKVIKCEVPVNLKTEEVLIIDREWTLGLIAEHAEKMAKDLEQKPSLNPKDPEEACCNRIQDWARKLNPEGIKSCPFCCTNLTPERTKKFFLPLGVEF